MRPLNRKNVNKGASASHFRGNVRRTKAPNVETRPMRGGYRL